ncbi:cobalamin biosynthesis protein [Shimia haliotis]|uniref:Cobalt-precorrin 5A hydrolase n=1 Tax=Shimia haliotis TaxID=1280847 RepID=A0A1I4GVF5_9RHOB|nr:cobalamin biosynthesis protein [Shimia haliotis]SFL34014.1 cobalt-precorrin 5A hydrolase [Shimia haliotis]
MIIAGFGFRATATLDSLRNALAATGEAQINAIATPSDKAQSQILQDMAAALSVPVIEIEPPAMHDAETATKSAKVQEKRGTGSVAEACALVAAGPDATLKGPRTISNDRLATCAIAYGAHT